MKNILLTSSLLVLLTGFLSCEPADDDRSGVHSNKLEMPESPPGEDKLVIYQIMTRLFGNKNTANKTYGSRVENGVGKFSDITSKALEELRVLGFTHIWYTGVLEHATMTAYPEDGIMPDDADVVKGRAGSPYAIKDYYDVAPDLSTEPSNRMSEFTGLIQRTHDEGLKVILDFVPNHVARSYHSDAKPVGVQDLGETDNPVAAFIPTNNFYYLPGTEFIVPADHNPLGEEEAYREDDRYEEIPAKATGNNVFSHEPNVGDWFETVKLNYGVDYQNGEETHFNPIPPTWKKMRDILLYWAGKGVDGFRCDMAEMVPVEFWEWAIPAVKAKHPKVIFIAEIYNPKRYVDFVEQGKFDYLYDKVGVYDTLRELMSGGGSTAKIAAARAQGDGIQNNMLRFLENHDEQRIASPQFAGTPWAAVPGMTVTALMGAGPVLVYFGQESGEPGAGEEGFQKDDGRTTIFDYWGVPEHQKWMNGGKFDGGKLSEEQLKLRAFYKNLLYLCHFDEAIRAGEYLPLPITDEKVFGFFRYTENRKLLVLANFDREAGRTASVPAGDWEKAGLNASTKSYQMQDVLHEGNNMLVEPGSFGEKGALEISLEPMGAMVFEVEAR